MSESSRRLDLQGLRGIAIIAVLIFHLSEYLCPAGYLGVDVFFVLSGYFMFQTANRIKNFDGVQKFYFRRLWRIGPMYLMIMFIITLVATFLSTPFDYADMLKDAVFAVLFISNVPSFHKTGYFDSESKNVTYMHTWSLSTEMQFYLFVPLWFWICNRYLNKLTTTSLLLSMGLISLTFQCFTSLPDAQHMLLCSRLWQFFLGFLAFGIRERIQKTANLDDDFGVQLLFGNIVPIVLSVNLCIPFFPNDQFVRIFVTFLSFCIITFCSSNSSWISNAVLVKLGDVSYSIYLIHWPIFNAHRAFNPDIYSQPKSQIYINLASLCFIALALGYMFETISMRALSLIKNWRLLIILMTFVYLLIGCNLFYLNKNKLTFVEFKEEISFNEARGIVNNLWEKYESRSAFANSKDLVEANAKLSKATMTLLECDTASVVNNSNPFALDKTDSYCIHKGSGNKKMVLFGNSHAAFGRFGIVDLFEPMYSEMISVVAYACLPVPAKYQEIHQLPRRRLKCEDVITRFPSRLRRLIGKADVAIILFGNGVPDPSIGGEFQDDESYRMIHRFYEELSDVVNDVIILSAMNIHFNLLPMQTMQRQLLIVNTSANMLTLGESAKDLIKYKPHHKRRLDYVDCAKCIKFNPFDLWCRIHEKGPMAFCSAIDPITKLSLFVDQHHVTAIGSLIYAKYIMSLYINLR